MPIVHEVGRQLSPADAEQLAHRNAEPARRQVVQGGVERGRRRVLPGHGQPRGFLGKRRDVFETARHLLERGRGRLGAFAVARQRRRLAAADHAVLLDLADHVAAVGRGAAREPEGVRSRSSIVWWRTVAFMAAKISTSNLEMDALAVEDGEDRQPQEDVRQRPGQRRHVVRQDGAVGVE